MKGRRRPAQPALRGERSQRNGQPASRREPLSFAQALCAAWNLERAAELLGGESVASPMPDRFENEAAARAQRYHEYAAELREQAAIVTIAQLRDLLLARAALYEKLAQANELGKRPP